MTSAVSNEWPSTSDGTPTAISSTRHSNFHFEPVDFGKNTSSAASRRARVPGGPAISQRLFAPRQKLRVEQQKRQPAEMVAVQMRQDNGVDAVWLDALPFQRRQRGGAAIDQ